MQTIVQVENRLYQVPLAQPLGDASHEKHTHFELVMCIVTTEDGCTGYGYTYTGGIGGTAIVELLDRDVTPALLGRDAACIEGIWSDLRRRLHYVGRGGIDAFAISAADIALWDIRCKRANLPLWKMVGGANGRARAYAGGIDLDFSREELLDSIRGYLRQGHTAVKIKLGKDTVAEDAARVAAVRELIGPDRTLMVDANYKWTAENALRVCRAIAPYRPLWMEEPVDPDDPDGYRRMTQQAGIAVAAGENFHFVYEFENMMASACIDYPQPDASNVGGITAWLKVAALAYARHCPVSTHGMQELHVSLLAGVCNAGWLEVHSFPIDRYTTHPLEVRDGYAYPPDESGTGVSFRFDLLDGYRVR